MTDTRIEQPVKAGKYVEVTLGQYLRLRVCEKKLRLLEAGGVDNWEWYGEAMEGFDEEAYRAELVSGDN